MQTSLAFLGVLSSILIGSQFATIPENSNPGQQARHAAEQVSNTQAWKITLYGSNTNCEFISALDSKNVVSSNYSPICREAIPGIDRLGNIYTNSTGDIELISISGDVLARFMESESSSYESLWPKYPLMTLAKIN